MELHDAELMRRIAAHDQQALLALYEAHGKAVYSLAYRILRSATLAEEVTQDTFFKVWQRTTQWDPKKGKLKNWLLTITHYTAIDYLRRERRQPMLHPDHIEDADETMFASSGDIRWQDGTMLRLLLAQLPKEQAALIDLAFFQGMSHNDIATVTQIPLGTVKTRLRTGLQRLRELWLETINQTSKQR